MLFDRLLLLVLFDASFQRRKKGRVWLNFSNSCQKHFGGRAVHLNCGFASLQKFADYEFLHHRVVGCRLAGARKITATLFPLFLSQCRTAVRNNFFGFFSKFEAILKLLFKFRDFTGAGEFRLAQAEQVSHATIIRRSEGSLGAAYPFPFFGSARLFSQLGNAPQLAIQFRVLRIDAADRVPSCVGFFVFFRILQSAGFTDDSR